MINLKNQWKRVLTVTNTLSTMKKKHFGIGITNFSSKMAIKYDAAIESFRNEVYNMQMHIIKVIFLSCYKYRFKNKFIKIDTHSIP